MFVIVSRELLRWLNEHRVLGKPYTISLVERWLWEHSLAEGKVLWRLETSTDGPVGGAIERVSNADNETKVRSACLTLHIRFPFLTNIKFDLTSILKCQD